MVLVYVYHNNLSCSDLVHRKRQLANFLTNSALICFHQITTITENKLHKTFPTYLKRLQKFNVNASLPKLLEIIPLFSESI